MSMELEGKVAVITGAAQGIGRACAERLAAEGAQVVLADIDADEGQAAAEAIGSSAVFSQTDMRDLSSVMAMAALAESRFGGVDILVNNAAVALNGVVDEIDEDRWSAVIDLNLSGVWRGMRACVPLMRQRGGGSVINMSSVQGLRAFAGWPAYAAAKGGINGLTVQTALDLAPAGIRVNAVAPGTILTPMNEKIFADLPDGGASLKEEWNSAHPIGRFGYPAEVADAVVFLASERSSFITGEVLRVDGGLAIRGA